MKNTKTKEPRYYEISVVRDTITRVVEVDDGISDEELEDCDYEFERYVKEDMLGEEMYEDNFVCVEKIPNHHEPEPRTFLYKDKNGRFKSGFVIQKGSESVMYFERLKNGEHILFEGFEMCFLSCSLEKTKELWNKGEIEELKSYFVPYEWSNNVEVINKIYESRNGRVIIHIIDKEEYQKKDGITEVLVDRTTPNQSKSGKEN